ncbi:MAG: flagellar biosynthetic protein FliO [Lachnospiraceae bacterium]|nr:flagellar biosynthetic protein FliO [Lachnospiraceae bacterium]
MLLTGVGTGDDLARLLSVLLIFIAVLGVTLYTTRWIAKYQKMQSVNRNIEVVETCRLTANKFVQIIRLGDTYVAVAVCKDTVTLLGEVPKDQIEFKVDSGGTSVNFKDFLEKAKLFNSGKNDESKEE